MLCHSDVLPYPCIFYLILKLLHIFLLIFFIWRQAKFRQIFRDRISNRTSAYNVNGIFIDSSVIIYIYIYIYTYIYIYIYIYFYFGLIQVTVPSAFPGSLIINSLCTHPVYKGSTESEWHNSSRISSSGRGDSLEQTCLGIGNSKTRKFSVNN